MVDLWVWGISVKMKTLSIYGWSSYSSLVKVHIAWMNLYIASWLAIGRAGQKSINTSNWFSLLTPKISQKCWISQLDLGLPPKITLSSFLVEILSKKVAMLDLSTYGSYSHRGSTKIPTLAGISSLSTSSLHVISLFIVRAPSTLIIISSISTNSGFPTLREHGISSRR